MFAAVRGKSVYPVFPYIFIANCTNFTEENAFKGEIMREELIASFLSPLSPAYAHRRLHAFYIFIKELTKWTNIKFFLIPPQIFLRNWFRNWMWKSFLWPSSWAVIPIWTIPMSGKWPARNSIKGSAPVKPPPQISWMPSSSQKPSNLFWKKELIFFIWHFLPVFLAPIMQPASQRKICVQSIRSGKSSWSIRWRHPWAKGFWSIMLFKRSGKALPLRSWKPGWKKIVIKWLTGSQWTIWII